MMQCAQCDHWVHAKCEGLSGETTKEYRFSPLLTLSPPQACRVTCALTVLGLVGSWEPLHLSNPLSPLSLAVLDEDYEILSGLPDSVLYTCGPCAGETQPRWREALSGALQGGLRQVLQGLLSSKVAGPLLLCTQVRRVPDAGWVELALALALLTSPICSVCRMGSSSTQDPVICKLWDSALRKVTISLW